MARNRQIPWGINKTDKGRTMNKGVILFNFGDKCMARLLVAVHTLRKVYDGPVTLMFAQNDEHNEKVASVFTDVYNCNIQWFDLDRTVRRNLKSVLKPMFFELSPYENSLMFDGDMIFTKKFDELFDWTDENGFVVTHFMNWLSNGKSMTKRIKSVLGDVFNEKQMNAALDHHPAVNIGVLGHHKKKGRKLLRKWKEITQKVAGKFIADEIAMQGVYIWYDHYVAPATYNYSCHYGTDINEAKIIHYHGNKHTGLHRQSSRLWWACVSEIIEEGKYDIEEWLLADPDCNRVLAENPDRVFLKDCYNEFLLKSEWGS